VRVYDSGSSTEMSKDEYRVRGSRTETKVLVPEAAGSFTIPALTLAHFDTKSRGYAEAKSAPIEIQVRGSAGGGGSTAGRQGIAVTGRDVRYIELELPDLRRTGASAGSAAGWALQAVPLAGLIAAAVYRRHRERLGADAAYARGRRAPKEVRRRLEAARAALAQSDARASYGEIAHAVAGFVADRLNLPPAALTPSSVGDVVQAAGADPALGAEVRDLLERCDQARFSAMPPDHGAAEADLRRSESLLQRLGRTRLNAPAESAR